MFNQLEPAPADPILGLSAAFDADERPHKINLGVGVYKDESGLTPVLESVKAAERLLLEEQSTKSYKPIEGDRAYDQAVQRLIFGQEHPALSRGRVVTAHTPGGTGALRVVADTLIQTVGGSTVWLSQPTWANHPTIFKAAGVLIRTYPYFDQPSRSIDFDAMMHALRHASNGDVLLLHGCCHNPTGADLSIEQWREVGRFCAEHGIVPLIDFAYHGFAEGIEEDAAPVRALTEICDELFVCSSFSKNFGLYNERVGALSVVASDAQAAGTVLSHVRKAIRANYSNPPAHGGAIVSTILQNEQLASQWRAELGEMRDRINGMRELFVRTLGEKGVQQDFGFVAEQRGMFSFSGLTPPEVERLREQHAVYAISSGRINVAGMTPDNMNALCEAIAAVVES